MSWVLVAVCVSGALQESAMAAGTYQVKLLTGVSRIPSKSRQVFANLEVGRQVELLGTQGDFAKVKVGGEEGYVPKAALLTPADFEKQRGPANEKELGEMAARGYEVGRFDPDTEKKLQELRPNLKEAYAAVDRLEGRLAWTSDRAKALKALEEFQKAGGLAEFGNVK
jgi:uncharacterized protein YgiM (DUF1202 family)